MPRNDYATCARTFATLRIYHKTARPAAVSRALRVKPSSTQVTGRPWKRRAKEPTTYPISGWFLTSQDQVESDDSTKHVFWLIDQIKERKAELRALEAAGWWMDISCYWDSRWGHGGPTLGSKLLAALAELQIEIWFDVYFSGAMEWARKTQAVRGTKGAAD